MLQRLCASITVFKCFDYDFQYQTRSTLQPTIRVGGWVHAHIQTHNVRGHICHLQVWLPFRWLSVCNLNTFMLAATLTHSQPLNGAFRPDWNSWLAGPEDIEDTAFELFLRSHFLDAVSNTQIALPPPPPSASFAKTADRASQKTEKTRGGGDQ